MRRADVKRDEERRLQAGRQGRDNSFKGLDASPLSSNDHNVSGFCQVYRRAFSIARLDAYHPITALSNSKPTFPACKVIQSTSAIIAYRTRSRPIADAPIKA
jgi:hypothetical protein